MQLTWIGALAVFTPLFLAGVLMADDAKVKERGRTDPPGVPLEARLVAKKDTYQLDRGCKTEAEYRALLRDRAYPLPDAPKVNLVLELRNTGDREFVIWVGGDYWENKARDGDYVELTLDLKGPGAVSILAAEWSKKNKVDPPVALVLAPGKVYAVPIGRLWYGIFGSGRHVERRDYWTRPGEYTLSASYRTAVSPAPPGVKAEGNGFGSVTVTAPPIKLKVVEKE